MANLTRLGILFLFPQLLYSLNDDSSYACLNCYGHDSFHNCNRYEYCNSSKKCMVRSVTTNDGDLKYFAGCVPKEQCDKNDSLISQSYFPHSHQICGKCCHGNECNRFICQAATEKSTYKTTNEANKPTTTVTSPAAQTTIKADMSTTFALTKSPTTTVPPHTFAMVTDSYFKCASCSGASDLDECTGVEMCHNYQWCSLSIMQEDGQNKIFGGCASEHDCDKDHKLISTDDYGIMQCGECCKNDNCNLNLCVNDTSAIKQIHTTSTSTSTTTAASTKPTNAPVLCNVCDGPLCGLFPGTDPKQKCPSNAPFCMNIVDNYESGQMDISKKCASQHECQTRWWEGSSDKPICTGFSADGSYYLQFTCVYCCTKPGCNVDVYPQKDTLFKGTSN